RGVGNMVRFDTLQPGPDGMIEIKFYSPGRVDLPGGDPIRGPGLNGLQLVLNPPPATEPPVITRQPASANGLAGGCITLSVEATGPNLSYQWLKNGQEIAGATDSQLTLANLSTNDAGNYTVIVSNPAGRVSSQTAVVGIVSSAQITLGLITHLKFDEDDPSTGVVNSAPGGQNGEARGVFPTATPGQIGNALILDPSFENYVFVPNYPKVSRSATIAGWVNLNSSSDTNPIINNWVEGRTTGQSGQFLVEVVPVDGVATLNAQIEVGPNRALATAPVDATPSVWHHFAVTANGITLSIYWDGQLVGTVDYLGNINMTPSIPWLAIGANLTGDNPPAVVPPLFGGQVDDFAIWNRSLSGLEIQGIYSGGLSGMSISQIPPVLTSGTCPPTITCSSNIVAECTGGLTPVTYTVTAVDSAGAPVPVVCVPPSGSGFRLGQSNVVCTATSGGASASCSFRVTVVDTTPPTVTCSSNITTTATGPTGAVVTYIASTADPCGLANFECAPPSGSTFPVGMTTVTCASTDGAGNANSCTFTVTVQPGGGNRPPTGCVASVLPAACVISNDTAVLVISANGADTCVNLAGGAVDPDGDALTFTWQIGGTNVAAGALVNLCLPLGCHTITMVASDGQASCSSVIELCVDTGEGAVASCVLLVDSTDLGGRNKRPLFATLKAAMASFANGNLNAALGQLGAFQNKVQAQIAPSNPAAAEAFISCAEQIVEAVICAVEEAEAQQGRGRN
ncbi:MAG: HYR domain-containing protein, partial [Verrucomicrobia subdivision 3 bacterium]|nr:HYR domain-containing protein [Limisphaerales bacterium]